MVRSTGSFPQANKPLNSVLDFSRWLSDVIIKTLDRLGENWDNRVKLSLWRRFTTILGPGTEKSTREVAKQFLGLNAPSRSPPGIRIPL
jgi:hypothetical protein